MTSSSFRSAISDDYQEESGVLDLQSIDEQLNDALDNVLAKSTNTRFCAFELLRKALTERYQIEYVYNRKVTILDTLGRCIKRNKGQEVGHAANLVSIVCCTLGPSPETDPIFNDLISNLLAHLDDQTMKPEIRTKCARSISICTFIISVDGYQEQIMHRLYAIFIASCAKGDGTMPNPSEATASLHSTCLQAWTLLLTALNNSSPQMAVDFVEEYMDKITELLDSPHLDLKITAGETLAIMFEIIKAQNVDLTGDDFADLCDKFREIMNDTQKSRAKKDLRHQRSNFREILAAIEEGETPNTIVKFRHERLILETWSKRRQYDSFCELFGNGFNHHLAENEIIRDIFGLGPIVLDIDIQRMKRSDNPYGNSTADKLRTKNMRRLRDKRADVID